MHVHTFKHPWTVPFRMVSDCVYQFDIVVAGGVAVSGGSVSRVFFGVLVVVACLIMICVASQAPKFIMDPLEKHTPVIFTFPGRFLVDFFIAITLLSMGTTGGFIMGTLTFLTIVGIRCLAIKEPELFLEIFRIPSTVVDMEDEYALEHDGQPTIPSAIV